MAFSGVNSLKHAKGKQSSANSKWEAALQCAYACFIESAVLLVRGQTRYCFVYCFFPDFVCLGEIWNVTRIRKI